MRVLILALGSTADVAPGAAHVDRLAAALGRATGDARYRRCAEELAVTLRSEDGAAIVAHALGQLV